MLVFLLLLIPPHQMFKTGFLQDQLAQLFRTFLTAPQKLRKLFRNVDTIRTLILTVLCSLEMLQFKDYLKSFKVQIYFKNLTQTAILRQLTVHTSTNFLLKFKMRINSLCF